jgi:tryptophanyl-tRNA synthetase
MNKETLVSGIRASSKPHIGNYLGALRQFVELQEKFNSYFFVADLHALTTPFEPKELRENTIEVVADYLALGLDPEKCVLFPQSHVKEHVELAWIFNCITPLGELYRMTQFKEKAENKEKANAGLLNYPVLMAADILLYKPQYVPVGEDQVQHVELARIIARKFNNKFGEVFPEPKPLLTKTSSRVKSLINPEKKMSKSNDEPLFLSDSPEIIAKKIKKAVTATDTKGKSAGVDNLFALLKEFGTQEELKHFETAHKNGTIKFSELKEALAKDISSHFADYRARREELLSDPAKIARVLAEGAEKARKVAQATMQEVRSKVGLI